MNSYIKGIFFRVVQSIFQNWTGFPRRRAVRTLDVPLASLTDVYKEAIVIIRDYFYNKFVKFHANLRT